ncbi:hypothetical protein AZZ69_005035, partial [Klebsiella pneumoniae]
FISLTRWSLKNEPQNYYFRCYLMFSACDLMPCGQSKRRRQLPVKWIWHGGWRFSERTKPSQKHVVAYRSHRT